MTKRTRKEETFHHQYSLKKDMPTYKKGWPLKWRGNEQRFYFALPSSWGYNKGEPDIYDDMEGPSFTVEQIRDEEWFEPVGKAVPFIPPFPTEANLSEYIHLEPETRLVDDVDVCRAINGLLNDKNFQQKLYEFYKKEYNRFYDLT